MCSVKKYKIAICLLVALLVINAFGKDLQPVKESDVMILLRGYEWQLNVAALSELPAGAYEILLDIATGVDYPIYIKSRALEALGYFPNDRVWAFLESELKIADRIKRRRIIDAFCQTFSAQRPTQVEAVISDYLQAEDAHLRVTVARCLNTIGSVSAIDKIRRYQSLTAESAELWERQALN